MFPQLPPENRLVFGLLLTVLGRSSVSIRSRAVSRSRVVFVELLGAIRTLEFMAFARNTGKGDGQNEQGEKFHRGAS